MNKIKKILLLANSQEGLALSGSILENDESFSFTYCSSANEALIASMQNSYDLIVCNLGLSEPNCQQFLQLNRNRVNPIPIPVLMLTDQEYKSNTKEKVWDHSINKPFTSNKVLPAMKSLLTK